MTSPIPIAEALEALIAKPRAAFDEGGARERQRADALAVLRADWEENARTLPRWPWARMDNLGWRSRVAPGIFEGVRRWHGSSSIVLLGPTGRGKTSALVARLHELRQRAERDIAVDEPADMPRFLFVSEPELVADRRQHPLGRGEAPLVALACTVPLLVLDELGWGGGEALVFEIADARYRTGRPTAVTSGRPEEALVAHYGAAAWRRLSEAAIVVDTHDPRP